jgi:hypothetical protein
MDSIRFYALAVGLFFAVFLGGKWLLIPTVVPLQPDARLPTFQRVDPDDPRTKPSKLRSATTTRHAIVCATRCSITPRPSMTIHATRS